MSPSHRENQAQQIPPFRERPNDIPLPIDRNGVRAP
jgi:hypothetical protein